LKKRRSAPRCISLTRFRIIETGSEFLVQG
jgi:hypothetical protein